MRTKETEELLLCEPNAFILLSLIAYRAKRTDSFSVQNLEPGQALIGDMVCGLTPRKYRTAKEKLKKWKFATFNTTNHGTIAKLLNTKIYDINIDDTDKPETNKRQTRDKPETTNKEIKKDKNYIYAREKNFSSLKDKFPEAYQKLEDRLTEISLQVWIDPLKFVSQENGTIKLFCPNKNVSWIEEHYMKVLKEVLEKDVEIVSEAE